MKKFLDKIEQAHDWFGKQGMGRDKFRDRVFQVLMWFTAIVSPLSLWGFRDWEHNAGTGKYPITMSIFLTLFMIICYLKVIVDIRKFIRKIKARRKEKLKYKKV